MPRGTFKRVTLKGDRSDRSLFLSVLSIIEDERGPAPSGTTGYHRVRMADGSHVHARLTTTSITLQRRPFVGTGRIQPQREE